MLSLVLLLAAPPANAWEVLTNSGGNELRWASMPISYSVNPGNPQGLSELSVTTAIVDAMEAWEEVEDAQVMFEDDGVTDLAQTVYEDDKNVIYFEDEWAYDSGLLALTSNWSDTATGELLGFDIRINAQDHEWTVDGDEDRDDLQNMITHEVGHALGMGHTELDEAAAMWGISQPGETTKRALKWDDKLGIGYLYGAFTDDDMDQRMSCSSTSADPSWIFFAFLALGVSFRQRGSDLSDVDGTKTRSSAAGATVPTATPTSSRG